MKILPGFFAVILSSLGLSDSAQAVDLSEFLGHYKGTVSMTTAFDGRTMFSGPVKIRVVVPNSRGDYALFRFKGSAAGNGTTFTVNSAFTFMKSSKRFVVAPDLLFGILPGAPGGLGKFSGSRHLLRFQITVVVGSDTATFSGRARLKTSGGKQRLLVSSTIATASQGEIFSFNFTTTKK